KGLHEPIISPEQFDAAQQILQARAHLPSRCQHSVHLLSGLARCGICGDRMTARYVYNRCKNGEGTAYMKYTHGTNEKSGPNDCKGFSNRAAVVERAVIDQMAAIAALR